MDATVVIKKPLITEKATWANGQNRYLFAVDKRASKTDIKKAVESLYKVRVTGVNTMTRRDRDRVYKYGKVEGRITKRAFVRIHPDDKIELF